MGSAEQYFSFVEQVKYEGPDSTNLLAFKDYNPEEIVLGRPMKDWLRFSVCYWHTFVNCGIGEWRCKVMLLKMRRLLPFICMLAHASIFRFIKG